MSTSSFKETSTESDTLASLIPLADSDDTQPQSIRIKKPRTKVGMKRSSTFFKFEAEKETE